MMTQVLGFFTPWIIYLLITILHYFLPGRWISGYVKDVKTGELLRYRLNGRLVLFSTVFIWFVLGYVDWVPYEWLYSIRWHSLAGAFVFGLLFSFWMVFSSPSTGKSWMTDLYLGRLINPQFQKGRIDAKMWLYLIGAVMLELNILSFIAHHHLLFGTVSPGLILCGSMLTYFIIDYLSFEKVHLYTYDIFAERVGIKLGWGCLTFYPYFYSIAIWATADLSDPKTPIWQLICYALLFLLG